MSRNDSLARLRLLSGLVAATLAACGGGSDSSPPPPPPPPPPAATTATITVKAADGLLSGAKGCYDLNDNNVCDATEQLSAASDANGIFTLEVAVAEVGKHRVVVDVPADAIDKDNNAAVGAAYRMTAPATGITTAHSVFVSPLTTAVQLQMDRSGQTLAQARDYIQAQAGLRVSPLADFTAAASADNTVAANAARLALQTARQQAAAVSTAVGQTDVSGAAITQAELDRAVATKVTAALPSIGAAAGDPAVTALTGQPRVDALAAAAAKVVTQIGFTADQAKFEIGLLKLPQATNAPAPTDAAILPALQYTNAANWFLRYVASTAADNTPDAAGLVRNYSVRTSMAPYAYQPNNGVATSAVRTFNPELHWSGTAWTECKLGERDTNTQRDAGGRSTYDSCKSHDLGYSQRGEIDITGQTLASVWANRIVPEVAKTTNPTSWSLSPAGVALLGTTAVFPAGSRLFLQSNTTTATAPTYNTVDTNRVIVFSDAVAQGGDARAGSVACSNAGTGAPTANLEEMVSRFPGKPCINNAATNADGTSLNPNEAWGPTTASLGNIANGTTQPAGTGAYYTTTALLRVAFTGANNATTYYRCFERRTPSSTRNCTPIGTGSYSIATLGDARVMSFANLPAEVVGLNSTRVFVERGGAVYVGFKNKVGAISTTVRLNLPAANAMLKQLALPIITPTEAPLALTGAKATNQNLMKGVWYFSDAFGTGLLRVGDNGEYVLAITDAPSATERPGYERGWLEVDAQGKLRRLLALDTDGEDGLSHFDPSVTLNITDTTFTFTQNGVTEGFDGRLPDSGSGIVGMWALGSATDLKVTQFVFFANGRVLSIHEAETGNSCAAARQGPPGIEWSDYSFVPATGALRIFNKIYDTSGCTGAFDSAAAVPNTEANLVLTIAADGKTATFLGDDGVTVLTFHRITPNP